MVLRYVVFMFLLIRLGVSDEIDDLIEEINSMNTTWKARRNFKGYGYVKKMQQPKPRGISENPLKVQRTIGPTTIPETFDARTKWPNCPTIASIQDQGACGACWAVAGAATFSDRVCIASGGKHKMPLSAHFLLSCCGSMCGSTRCDGGDDYRAWVFFRKTGTVTGGGYNSSLGCQPYPIAPCQHHTVGPREDCQSLEEPHVPECIKTCTNNLHPTPLEEEYFKAKSAYKVMSDPQEIKKEILAFGPVQAGITIYEDFELYQTGVYQRVSQKMVGEHSVRIIGWGKEKGVPYWLVANSWNTDWGEKGYAKIIMGKNELGIEHAIHAGQPLL